MQHLGRLFLAELGHRRVTENDPKETLAANGRSSRR